jgi:DNA-binding transcriptional ArsR family regulator
MQTDQLSATFSALADPTRRAILAKLAKGEATVGDLAKPFDMTLPAVIKHLKVLENAGLVKKERSAQWRPCHLEAKPLKQAAGWIDDYRQFWETNFDRLDDYLQEMQATKPRKRKSKK